MNNIPRPAAKTLPADLLAYFERMGYAPNPVTGKYERKQPANCNLRQRGYDNFHRMMAGEPHSPPATPAEWAGWNQARRALTGDWSF